MKPERRIAGGQAFEVPAGTYLLSHSVGCLPLQSRGMLEGLLFDPWASEGSDAWPAWLTAVEAFRAALATLLGGRVADWCPQPGVSAAIFRLLSSLPQDGRRTLLVSRHAFPSVGYALTGLERLGYRTRFVEGDPADINAWTDAMTDDVAAAVFMHVHSNSGVIPPLAELGMIARRRGIFTIADICQSAGVVPLKVTDLNVDAVAGSCVKWLCGGPGAGFLWVSPNVVRSLAPPDRGWFSHADPFEFDIERFRYAPDALRFWGGTPSIAPYIVAASGVRTIAGIGVATIWRHNRALIRAMRSALPAMLAERIDMTARGGTLCLDFGPAAPAQEARLREQGLRIDRRGSVLRLSFHIFNTEAEAVALGAVLGAEGGAPFRMAGG